MTSSPHNSSLAAEGVDQDEIACRIGVMRMQEENGYHCPDYLEQQSLAHKDRTKPVDEACRVKMSEWCYQVVDFYKFNRQTVWIAMSYLDRFLATKLGKPALEDRKIFQLAAMTALYTAIKIFEPEVMEPAVVSVALSRGTYSEKEITDMESLILEALQWRVQPPTALCFAQHFLALLPAEIASSERQSMVDYSRFQTELAVNDYFFVKLNPSTVAIASILNAIDMISHVSEMSESVSVLARLRTTFLETVMNTASVDISSAEIKEAQGKLLNMFSKSYGCGTSSSVRCPQKTVSSYQSQKNSTGAASPRSVVRESENAGR